MPQWRGVLLAAPPAPSTAVMGEDHNFPLPGGQAHAEAPWWELGVLSRASTGKPQGAGLGPRLRMTVVGAHGAFQEAEAMGGPAADPH